MRFLQVLPKLNDTSDFISKIVATYYSRRRISRDSNHDKFARSIAALTVQAFETVQRHAKGSFEKIIGHYLKPTWLSDTKKLIEYDF